MEALYSPFLQLDSALQDLRRLSSMHFTRDSRDDLVVHISKLMLEGDADCLWDPPAETGCCVET